MTHNLGKRSFHWKFDNGECDITIDTRSIRAIVSKSKQKNPTEFFWHNEDSFQSALLNDSFGNCLQFVSWFGDTSELIAFVTLIRKEVAADVEQLNLL